MAVTNPGSRRALAPGLAAAILAAAGVAPARADPWTDLWLRRDQQGDRALEAGHAEQALRLYDDPRRRGYAELEAGQYAAAARDLEPYRDPLAQYDRGNALARAGQLQPALDAYDAALGHAAAGTALARDARHNRELVAKALAQQPPQPGAGRRGTQGEAGQPSSPSRPDPESQHSGMNQSAAQQGSSGQGGLGKANPSPGDPTPADPRSGAGRSGGGSGAARDAAATAATRRTPLEGSGEGEADRRAAAAAGANTGRAPESEQAIARAQWLRQIPDDPAGLLRRKFMIEHLLHEQELRP